jgi:hypothetical protein
MVNKSAKMSCRHESAFFRRSFEGRKISLRFAFCPRGKSDDSPSYSQLWQELGKTALPRHDGSGFNAREMSHSPKAKSPGRPAGARIAADRR